ncbi:DBF4-type zinc finger-containing protein 2 [Channa argus]|uniref:DBF4-type zinc finger-containing protein 2 n=1 Tax=Channa argus TaxID=215402 RepID=A0A6G1PDC9_CHAAH|nr:DBF4-type zinc finger-containing protein 2 [Channa argus]KAK2917220.1 hypothetical protein Q8A73_003966 [Channa argus]
MSDCPEEGKDDQKTMESTSRMWVDSQPGPSRCQSNRQGYCGYCRVLYSNLDQHLSSLRHLDSVRVSSRGSSTVSSSSSSKTKLTLLERFLQDVLQHHPQQYSDTRPSYADLPSVSVPLLPKAELGEIHFSDNSRSLGTWEHLTSSDDTSHQSSSHKEGGSNRSRSAEGITERLSALIRIKDGETAPTRHTHSPRTRSPPLLTQTLPPVYRKAHRKSNRRKTSEESSPYSCTGLGPQPPSNPKLSPGPGPVTRLRGDLRNELGQGSGPRPSSEQRPWRSWQKQRREAQKEEAFSTHSNDLDQTIEEVILMRCYGISSTLHPQEETESLQISLPLSVEKQSDDWDSPVQVVFHPPPSPVQLRHTENLVQLMDVQVHLEDQVYSCQLESALHRRGGGTRQDQGFWTLPIEQVLPAPRYIPESFRGKTWTQIEQEDEERVERLVHQFRRDRFICYFDSESLARYGRRSQNKKGCTDNKEVESDPGVLPLLDRDDDSVYLRRMRGFRLASRCQVVKVSHSTQTVRLVVPTILQPDPEAPLPNVTADNQVATERTPEMWRCLPLSYSNIVTPVQPHTSLVYLLCSPSGPSPADSPAASPALRRCRKKRRPLDLHGLKVKYKPFPVRFYDPSTHRILKNPPKGSLWCQGPGPSSLPPPCVRQLFRSLSPNLNADRLPWEEASGVKGQRMVHPPCSFLISTLSRKQDTVRRRGQTSEATPSYTRSERGRGGRRERTRPPPSTKKPRAQTLLPQPRREGLRWAGPGRKVTGSTGPNPLPSNPRRGRGRRGRGCERGRS